ncbi:MAG TPA: hypothetical protein PL110_01425 [Candidatus Eremiobacteraeota bacterium]|nr:MAG: hypothetical protein BWY64_00278 [bacterium ADurb.Bin363]HPZ06748.1 hypothetical protein [Candidatus Eremiobacteraeota bacterium]
MIKGLNQWNPSDPGITPLKAREEKKSSAPGELFIRTSSEEPQDTKTLAEYAKKVLKENGLSQASETRHQGKIFSIGDSGITTVPLRTDGGHLVEEETGTVAYYGDTAKKLLKKTTFFPDETIVTIPSSGSIRVTVNGQSLSFSEAGSILLGAGTEAKVEILKGEPLVTTTEKPPSWYKKHKPGGEHQAGFDKITEINKHLFACHTIKSRFKENQLEKLLAGGIVKNVKNNDKYIEWASFSTQEELQSKLKESGFSTKDMEDISSLWYQTIKRKLQSMESGHVDKNKFRRETLKKLLQSGILREFSLKGNEAFWTSFSTEQEMRSKLSAGSIFGSEAEEVLSVWRKTTKSGYDNTGLAWDKGKVVAYLLNNKINIWNEQATEWIVNSTAYAGENEPFTVGVSNVIAKKELSEPVAFKSIRPGESLHRHPQTDDKKQTECYLVTGGRAALLTIHDGKPHISILQTGDMAVINPGITHCVLAVDGPYEHLVFQVPSAFQYGLIFKDNQNYSDHSVTEEEILSFALKKLKETSENPDKIDEEGTVVPGFYQSGKKDDPYLLYDGFDSSRDITGLTVEEGKSDEPLHLTLKLKDLQPGAEEGNLDAYFLIGTGNDGQRTLPDGIAGATKIPWNIAVGAYDNNNYSISDEKGSRDKKLLKVVKFDPDKDTVEVYLDKDILREKGWHDSEKLTVQPFTAKDFTSQVTDSLDRPDKKPWWGTQNGTLSSCLETGSSPLLEMEYNFSPSTLPGRKS